MSYQIEQIALEVGAFRVGDIPATIDWLLTDSRSLSFPEATLFFALTTKRNSGAHYIKELYQRGVRNFVVSRSDYPEVETLNIQDANFLLVPDTLSALQKLAQSIIRYESCYMNKNHTQYGSCTKVLNLPFLKQVFLNQERWKPCVISYNLPLAY